jgi:uncharacterized protein (DUF1800 family)
MAATAIALNRFGLGARAADPIPPDPKGWLLGQFDRFEARPPALADVPTRGEVVQQLGDYIAEARMQRGARQMQPASMPNEQASGGFPTRRSAISGARSATITW